MRKIGIVLYLILCYSLSTVAVSNYYPSTMNGESGERLKRILHNHISVHSAVQIDGWELFKTTDSRADGTVWSFYSNEIIPFPTNDNRTQLDIDRLVSPSWSGDIYPYTHELTRDLHQITPAPIDVITHKRDYPVGELCEVLYTNGVWSMGYSMLLDTKINAFEPADEYKGDVARIIMYIATCYSHYKWHSFGMNIFSGGAFPTLNSHSRALLLKWHRADKVSDKEIARNNAVFAIQGNRNPFVDYPVLAEHIWGTMIDEGFQLPTDEPVEPDEELIPLRSTYRLSDSRIDLYSPYIPVGVEWSVNGIVATQPFIVPSELGVGKHELRYIGESAKGIMIIKIEP